MTYRAASDEPVSVNSRRMLCASRSTPSPDPHGRPIRSFPVSPRLIHVSSAQPLRFCTASTLIGLIHYFSRYMGVTSLAATQLFDRFSLLFIPVESHPQTSYVRNTPTWKMHLYTLIQILCLALLWLIKSVKAISIAFPLFFILLVPMRLQLTRFYSESELEAVRLQRFQRASPCPLN